jgi:hypothetical protein
MRSTVHDASQSAAAGVDTRPSNSMSAFAFPTPPPLMPFGSSLHALDLFAVKASGAARVACRAAFHCWRADGRRAVRRCDVSWSFPPPALRERGHRGLSCRFVAVRRRAPAKNSSKKRVSFLRNGVVCPVFALYVATCGQVSTESGRGQRPRSAGTRPVHKERIRKRGGRLGRACRTSGADRRGEVPPTRPRK